MDSPENEALENGSFWVRFSGGGTLYVQTPAGQRYICGKSEVPPEATHMLCVVEIIVWCARQAVEAYPLLTTPVMLSTLRVKMSLVMRKPAFCICKNKDADQLCGNREANH